MHGSKESAGMVKRRGCEAEGAPRLKGLLNPVNGFFAFGGELRGRESFLAVVCQTMTPDPFTSPSRPLYFAIADKSGRPAG